VKTISWGIASSKAAVGDQATTPTSPSQYKQFSPKETEVYLRLMKWGLKAIDIYAVNGPPVNLNGVISQQRPIATQGVRSKEEKEVLEHFAGAVSGISIVW
jgi:transformation/transcription domain-associated protein